MNKPLLHSNGNNLTLEKMAALHGLEVEGYFSKYSAFFHPNSSLFVKQWILY